jgi:hypothetical protein
MAEVLKDPIGIPFGSIQTMKALATGQIIRKTSLTDEVAGLTIDTCDTVDCGWETGIKPANGIWVIVESYPDIESATAGHQRWKLSIERNPTQKLKSIQYEITEDVEENEEED